MLFMIRPRDKIVMDYRIPSSSYYPQDMLTRARRKKMEKVKLVDWDPVANAEYIIVNGGSHSISREDVLEIFKSPTI